MIRLTQLLDRAPSAAEAARAVRLRLTFDERAKSRLATIGAAGEAVAILLPRGAVMRNGALLAGDDGELAIVAAAPQPVSRITADSPLGLLRAVYHLANRHVAAQLAEDHVLIERDPVLEAMLRALGARIEHLDAPFDPEGGAYQGHHGAHAHGPHGVTDTDSATIGEQLSIAAHARRTR